MAALIQDEQLTEHSIRENYDDGDDGDGGTSLFPSVFPAEPFQGQVIYFHNFYEVMCRMSVIFQVDPKRMFQSFRLF